jgi:peptide/nickel transport system permease protein
MKTGARNYFETLGENFVEYRFDKRCILLKYILKRLGISVLVLFLTTVVIFVLVQLQPGNPYSYMISPDTPKEMTEAMLRSVGYYDSIEVKYFRWIQRALVGDLGFSIKYGRSVMDVVLLRLPNTILLASFAGCLSLLVAIPLGVHLAIRHKSALDYVVMVISMAAVSIPSFFFSLILIKTLGYDLKLLPISHMETVVANYEGLDRVWDIFRHMLMPAAVLAFTQISTIARYVRNSMLEVADKEYIRTAIGKGLGYEQAIWRHGFKNIATSVVTVVFMQIPKLMSGALITETIFVWPGLGRLNYEAIMGKDFPLIMGILLLISLTVLATNLLADILCCFIDRRVKYQ